MKRYVIERDIPGLGKSSLEELSAAATETNNSIKETGNRVRWEHSYIVDDKSYCIYLAESIQALEAHAKVAGFPANKINEVKSILDPTKDIKITKR